MTAALNASQLEAYTKGRLPQNDYETWRTLNAALAEVRNYCRWHVVPVIAGDQITLDGPDDSLLMLPTKHLTALTTVVEDGVTLDVSTLQWSQRGLVLKPSMARWSGNYRSINVTMTHGYTEAQAADWCRIVLAVADRMSQVRGLIGPASVTVGPYAIGQFDADVGWLDDLFNRIDPDNYLRTEAEV